MLIFAILGNKYNLFMVSVMMLLNTTAGSSRRFHDEVINSNFGELIYLYFSFMWFVMGEEEITKPVQSFALSCS